MTLKVNLKEHLEEKNISQRELSRLTGLNVATINRYCQGDVDGIRLTNLTKIANALKIEDIGELINMEQEDGHGS